MSRSGERDPGIGDIITGMMPLRFPVPEITLGNLLDIKRKVAHNIKHIFFLTWQSFLTNRFIKKEDRKRDHHDLFYKMFK